MELAGVQEEDIAVTLYQDMLVVEGHRENDEQGGEVTAYHEAGIQYGGFQAEIDLPAPVDADGVTACYDRGVLRINLPKAATDPRLQEGVAA